MADCTAKVQRAFSDHPKLSSAINQALTETPQHTGIFKDIAQYVLDLKSATAPASADAVPASKKRRLDEGLSIPYGSGKDGTQAGRNGDDGALQLDAGDLSFLIPRKKLRLEITSTGLRGVNSSTDEVECRVRWGAIEHVACLPVPEKSQPQYSFCIFPQGADGLAGSAAAPDAIVFTVPDTPPKSTTGPAAERAPAEAQSSYRALLLWLLNEQLARGGGGGGGTPNVVEPMPAEFASALVQAHRKGEKAAHVKAFRGSKEGFLFFLPSGIVWAFKKPLLFFGFAAIASISYTSVLQRTFNLNVAVPLSAEGGGGQGEVQDFEFSMLDQADFPGIDAYVKRHGLHDASMAEQRRAKRVNVNGREGNAGAGDASAGGAGENGVDGPAEDGQGEAGLRPGADMDEEDEEEEDYDPGSEGESEGSGSSSEDEDGHGGDGDGEEVEEYAEAEEEEEEEEEEE